MVCVLSSFSPDGDFDGVLLMSASCCQFFSSVNNCVPSICCELDFEYLCVWSDDPAAFAGEAVRWTLHLDWLLTEVSFMWRVVQRSPLVCVCVSEYVVWLRAHVRRLAGVSAVEECETECERSVTDGGIVPLTQFVLQCCTEREEKREAGEALMFLVDHVLNICSSWQWKYRGFLKTSL